MNGKLENLSENLLQTWCNTLLEHQVTNLNSPGLKGGLLSPAYGRIEGRCAETVYPFLYLADKNKDSRYLDASIQLINWAENNVIFPDGSWVNEVSISDWRGVTVNAVIALAEALLRHGHLLENKEYDRWIRLVKRSSEWVYNTIDLGYGNINYPVVTTYTLAITGQLLDEKKYLKRADELAGKVLPFFTEKDHLLFGEGTPYNLKSPKGCYALDLAYNVEESLPALALYGLLAKNEEVLEVLTESLKSHLEFMLPDGAWDNSWGTRNYKWTYWGGRNSDGCQPAYALLANRDPQFYEAALRNTELLEKCTTDGLLHGGPHNAIHGELPSIHHTFCHAKAMATILDYGIPERQDDARVILPREEDEKGFLAFSDIQTWLVSKGGFKATITGYDRQYESNTHATGGAISMLWHTLTGPLLTASLSEYRLLEATNMQMDKDPFSMPLTPRLELRQNNKTFRSSSDLSAKIEVVNSSEMVEFLVDAHLVDGAQNSPENGKLPVRFHYSFDHNLMTISAFGSIKSKGQLNFYLPVISVKSEKFYFVSKNKLCIEKENAKLIIACNTNISIAPTKDGRIFNFVPGFEALPVSVECAENSNQLFKLSIEVVQD